MAIGFVYAAKSDIGLVRANNQDSGYAGPHLLLVADGMGGHAGGDIASSIAVAAISPLDGDSFTSANILDELRSAVSKAQSELVQTAKDDETLAGMGTTVTALLRSGNKIAMAHIGDSRGYLFKKDSLTQITKDHTFVQHLIDAGKITEAEAEDHPQRSVVTKVLGDFELDFDPDLSIREAHSGDRWLLCSDGLSGFVSFDTIERTLREEEDPAVCANKLIQYALRAGGSDNITCIVADVVDTNEEDTPYPTIQVVGAASQEEKATDDTLDGPATRAAKLLAETRARVAAVQEMNTSGVNHSESPNGETEGKTELTLSKAEKKALKKQKKSDKKAEKAERLSNLSKRELARKRWIGSVQWLSVLMLLAFMAAAAGYYWSQQQYFVSVENGYVAIFKGIPEEVGPFELSTVVEVSDISTSSLPTFVVQQLEETVHATSLEDAEKRVETIRLDRMIEGG